MKTDKTRLKSLSYLEKKLYKKDSIKKECQKQQERTEKQVQEKLFTKLVKKTINDYQFDIKAIKSYTTSSKKPVAEIERLQKLILRLKSEKFKNTIFESWKLLKEQPKHKNTTFEYHLTETLLDYDEMENKDIKIY
ncbi:MAG: hypothetical protein Ta2D_07720 [Rickettsiales bacterium]|nr:MAG: hypothetical protein Ta2D_07720 [Rickettsiales bacterium]